MLIYQIFPKNKNQKPKKREGDIIEELKIIN